MAIYTIGICNGFQRTKSKKMSLSSRARVGEIRAGLCYDMPGTYCSRVVCSGNVSLT